MRTFLRKIAFILSLILLTVSFYGCDPYFFFGHGGTKFSDMEYERPDMDETYEKLDKLIDMIENNKYSYNTLLKKLQEFISEDYNNFLTMSTLAFVKFVITPDSDALFEEYYYLAEESGNFSAAMEDLFVACAQSKHCDKFERDCFGEGQLEEYKEGITYTDRSIELLTKEAQLVADYKNLCADENASPEQFGELYAELVRTRLSLSDELGYGSYAEYEFDMLERDYTPEEAFSYVDDIIESIVPIFRERGESGLMWEGENRSLSSDELIETVGEIMENIGSYTDDPFDFMKKYELLYVADSGFAVTESFTTYLFDYYSPFTYISSTGSLDDISVLVHEFGHFTDEYYNYGQNYILDLCEIASQALELIAMNYYGECSTLSEEDAAYLKSYVYDTFLSVFIQQSLFTKFEEKVYSLPYNEVTAENINKAAEDVVKETGLDGLLDGFIPSWYTITHFFNQAFYVTSYITSGDVALQIYEISLESDKDALAQYKKLLNWDLDMNFIDNVERAGLESPFSKGRAAKLAEILSVSFD